MPKPQPLPRSTREQVAARIRAGEGRNAIARAVGISPGSVTAIAREHGLRFNQAHSTATAVRARQIDLATKRQAREQQLLTAQLHALNINNLTRARHLERQLYDIHRFHQFR